MATRRITSAALAAALVATVGVGVFTAGQQSASAADIADDTLTGRTAQEREVDTGRSGPSVGDRYVFSERIFDEDGKRVGMLVASCDLNYVVRSSSGKVRNTIMQCVGTFRLKDGSISVAGATSWDEKTSTLAIVGGTDSYDRASGEVKITSPSDNRNKYDFDFNNTNDGGLV